MDITIFKGGVNTYAPVSDMVSEFHTKEWKKLELYFNLFWKGNSF